MIKERNSGIELLKVLAVFMIVISHCIPYSQNIRYLHIYLNSLIDISNASENISQVVLVFFKYLGQLGNIIFIICSSYFLYDSGKKNNIKIIYIWSDTFVISVLWLITAFLLKVDISTDAIIKSLFPITFSTNWFVGCYIMFYLISPFLNMAVNSMDKRKMLCANVLLLWLYGVIAFISSDTTLYFTELVGFIMIYFITVYLKKYLSEISNNLKINFIILAAAVMIFISMILLLNYAGLHISTLSDKMLYFNRINNIILIIIAAALFNIFRNFKKKNKYINYISSLSLLVYIIHENYIFGNYLRPIFWNLIRNLYVANTYPNIKIVVYSILFSSVIMVISIALSIVYKEILRKFVSKMADKVYFIICKFLNSILELLMKFN